MCVQCYGAVEVGASLLVAGRLWYVSSVKPRLRGRQRDDDRAAPDPARPS